MLGKLVTTALCSVAILGVRLSQKKWMYLFILTLGATAVQMNSMGKTTGDEKLTLMLTLILALNLTLALTLILIMAVGGDAKSGSSTITGLIVVVVGCVTSSAAGVYFEKVLKLPSHKPKLKSSI